MNRTPPLGIGIPRYCYPQCANLANDWCADCWQGGGNGALPAMTHTFGWGNNEKRSTLKGRACRVISSGAKQSCLVEFDDGQREIVSRRALRRIPSGFEQVMEGRND